MRSNDGRKVLEALRDLEGPSGWVVASSARDRAGMTEEAFAEAIASLKRVGAIDVQGDDFYRLNGTGREILAKPEPDARPSKANLVDDAFRALQTINSMAPGVDKTFHGPSCSDAAMEMLVGLEWVRPMGLAIQLTRAGWEAARDPAYARQKLREQQVRSELHAQQQTAARMVDQADQMSAQAEEADRTFVPAMTIDDGVVRSTRPPGSEDAEEGDRQSTGFRNASILFMDVSKFTSLDSRALKTYVTEAMPRLAEKVKERAWFVNTWGDAIVAAFESCNAAAEVALDLRDEFLRGGYHIPSGLRCRISLHAGQVYVEKNPFLLRKDISAMTSTWRLGWNRSQFLATSSAPRSSTSRWPRWASGRGSSISRFSFQRRGRRFRPTSSQERMSTTRGPD